LGFDGLVGAEKTETAKILIGAVRYSHGEIFINRKWAKVQLVFEVICSLGPLTVERRKDGLIMSFDIKTNVIMTTWGCVANNWLLPASEKKDSAGARQQVADLGIKTFGFET
jgi:ABC-type sugar transport system ATPase subunit